MFGPYFSLLCWTAASQRPAFDFLLHLKIVKTTGELITQDEYSMENSHQQINSYNMYMQTYLRAYMHGDKDRRDQRCEYNRASKIISPVVSLPLVSGFRNPLSCCRQANACGNLSRN